MICPNGHQVRPGVKFCKTCGVPLGDAREADDPVVASPDPPATVGEQPEAEVTPPPGRNAKETRRISGRQLVRWSLGFLAVLAGGVALGHLIAPPQVSYVAEAEATTEPVGLAATLRVEPELMPDVTLLEQDVALAILADHGVAADDVTVAQEPWAGEPGRVLRSEPTAGQPASGPVLLVMSDTAKVPDLAGLPRAEAVAAVENLGAVARVTASYEPGAQAGTTLSSNPGAGEDMPEVVEVVVADVGEAVDVTTLSTVDYSDAWNETDVSGNGQVFATALEFSPDPPNNDEDPLEPAFLSFNLGRQMDRLEGTVALDDQGSTRGRLKLQVIGDGTEIAVREVGFGESQTLSVDVRGVLRLRLDVLPNGRDDDQPVLYLGDPRLVGSPEAVAELLAAN